MLNHATIRTLAKQLKRSTKDLLALASNNDPFYADREGRRFEAEWFAEQWERFDFQKGVHTRRIHYRLISQGKDGPPVLKPDGTPYQNTQNDSAMLYRASRDARYLDLIPLDALVDRRNDEPMIFSPAGVAEHPEPFVEDMTPDAVSYVEDPPNVPNFILSGMEPYQNYVVEVWIEKSTQNDWLVPLCQRRGVTLVTGIGEQSEIQSRELVLRTAEHEKPMRVIYLSDFDPGGQSMPVAVARKCEFYIHKFDLDIDFTLTPLVLTEDQCEAYDLPRTPIKETERRKQKFEERFGRGATELDALEAVRPGEMAKLLEEEFDLYLDPTFGERLCEAKWDLERQLRNIEKDIHEKHRETLEELEGEYHHIIDDLKGWDDRAETTWEQITHELEQQMPSFEGYEPPTPRPAREPFDVLFNSKRDYFTQLDYYHDQQRR